MAVDSLYKKILKDTFQDKFELGKFEHFVIQLFNHFDLSNKSSLQAQLNKDEKEHIRDFHYLGEYIDPKNEAVDVLIVELRSGRTVERARSLQRNLIGRYLKANLAKASNALVAFYAQDSADWRLSFVKVETKLSNSGVKVDIGTPPKRYSFLVGQTEPSHTAQKQVSDILKGSKLLLVSEVESAFSVEKVTKEFYEQYKRLFEDLSADLKKNKSFQIIASKEQIDIDNFSKKLLGQIVFLYFLQKKGWLGVPRDNKWGDGDKFFLRTLFDKCKNEKKNFYNDILEHLFYDTLNNPRRDEVDQSYSRYFDCKIPFLNGGLFEPDYDWKNTIVHLENDIFEEIIDIFDLYNFTVKEDEPLEREVAVDPEMLGKVFENLLEENLRKGKGTYYTPREIVHYMCQESLVNYLTTQTKISEDNARALITFKDNVITKEHVSECKKPNVLTLWENEIESLNRALSSIKVCDPACGSGAFLVGMLNEIVSARKVLDSKQGEYQLKKETIQNCIYGVDIDPGAVEIAKLRLWLSLVVDYDLAEIEPLPNLDYKIMCGNSLLEELIVGDESIKLFDERLLGIREEKQDEGLFEIPQEGSLSQRPRRDLLQKELQAKQAQLMKLHNSGQLTLEIRREFDSKITALDKELNPRVKKAKFLNVHPMLFQQKADHYFSTLKELHKKYFTEYDPIRKKEKRRQIEDIEFEFINASIKEKIHEIDGRIKNLNMQKPEDRKKNTELMKKKLEYMSIPEEIHRSKVRPYFLWKLNFFEVFQEKDGFDVAIANPPYLRIQEIQKNNPELAEKLKEVYFSAVGSFDVYICFIELVIKLINTKGNIAFIVPHKFFQGAFGKNIREIISGQKLLHKIVDFGSGQAFESVTTYTCLLFLSFDNKSFRFAEFKPNALTNDVRDILGMIDSNESQNLEKVDVAIITHDLVSKEEWHFSAGTSGKILSKLKKQPRTLVDVCQKIFQGIATSADKIFFLEHISESKGKLKVFSKSLNKEIFIEKEFVKPLVKGEDVHRWAKLKPRIWCIFPYEIKEGGAGLYSPKEIRDRYPLAWDYLLKNKKDLEDRERGRMNHEHFYAYIYPKNLTEFQKKKIITPEISLGCNLTYDDVGLYHNTKCYSFVFKDEVRESVLYFLAILNSKLLWYFLTNTGYVLRGGYFVFKTNYLMPFPLPKELSLSEQKPFIILAEKISVLAKSNDYEENLEKQSKVNDLERQINQMVYKLYGLTEEEINIVENGEK